MLAGHKSAIVSFSADFNRLKSSPDVIFGATLPIGSVKNNIECAIYFARISINVMFTLIVRFVRANLLIETKWTFDYI